MIPVPCEYFGTYKLLGEMYEFKTFCNFETSYCIRTALFYYLCGIFHWRQARCARIFSAKTEGKAETPRESVKIWERMQKENKGQEVPEWMSTHPSSKRRIDSLNNWIPEIIIKYPPIKKLT